MKRPSAFVALAVLTLTCWLSLPSKSYAQAYLGSPWGGWGLGGYGWGGYGLGGWGLGGYGLGGRGYPWYPSNYTWPNNGYTSAYSYMTPGYYATPSYNTTSNYYATPNYITPAAYVEPLHVTTTSITSTATANQGTRSNRASIYVEVPADAQVFFDSTAMHQKGSRRVFQTPPLQPNESGYSYEVTALWTENGKEHREKRTIRVTPGGTTDVNFLADQNSVTPASTQAAPASQAPRNPGDGK